MIATASPTFVDALHADGPAPDRADKMRLYGQFVGAWEMDVVGYEENGTKHAGRGEIHFGWVLEGRAIQDVWMIPRRAERRPGIPEMPVTGNWYGTTLRLYDPGIDAWHILWNDPLKQYSPRQIGRARGNDIVQEGRTDAGEAIRWSFTEITPDSFRWTGERSRNGGSTWHVEAEFLARRVKG